MKKNDVLIVTIHDLTETGDGVALHHKHQVYIPNTLPGERVKTLILKVNKHHAFGKCLSVLDPNEDRQNAPCPISTQCGGCQLLHHTYDAHLNWKQRLLNAKLTDHLPKTSMPRIKPSPLITGFRNKAQFAFQTDKDGIKLGLYARGSHRVIDTPHCMIQMSAINEVLHHCRLFFQNTDLSCYDDTTQTGLLRYVVIRTTTLNETMIALVTTSDTVPFLEKWISVMSKIPHVKSIFINVNTLQSDIILGPKSTLLWGHPTIRERFKDTSFNISLSAFFQLNPSQTRVLYEDIRTLILDINPKHILDLYCGSGTIGLFSAPKTTPLTGIEVNPQSVRDAASNADLNDHKLAQFIQGTVEEGHPQWGCSPDLVILDPPRKGCDVTVLNTLRHHHPATIVYVSCNTTTLCRDLEILKKTYTIDAIQAYDMFPFTPHIEVMVVLTSSAKTA